MLTKSEIPGLDVKRDNRFALIDLSYEALAKLLDLPKEATIVHVIDMDSTGSNYIRLKVVHTAVKETQDGGTIPTITVGQLGWDRIG